MQVDWILIFSISEKNSETLIKFVNCPDFCRFSSKDLLATSQFFPLTLARNKRGEGLSPTLNKGLALHWLTGGLVSLYWLISNSPPSHCGTRVVTPGQGNDPPIQRA